MSNDQSISDTGEGTTASRKMVEYTGTAPSNTNQTFESTTNMPHTTVTEQHQTNVPSGHLIEQGTSNKTLSLLGQDTTLVSFNDQAAHNTTSIYGELVQIRPKMVNELPDFKGWEVPKTEAPFAIYFGCSFLLLVVSELVLFFLMDLNNYFESVKYAYSNLKQYFGKNIEEDPVRSIRSHKQKKSYHRRTWHRFRFQMR